MIALVRALSFCPNARSTDRVQDGHRPFEIFFFSFSGPGSSCAGPPGMHCLLYRRFALRHRALEPAEELVTTTLRGARYT